MFKSGFVAIIGHSNVGKSTFLNSILKQKVSIVTDKIQTTRNQIRGVYNQDDCQIVFIDTPGVHKAKNELSKYMNTQAFLATKNSEIILFFAAADENITDNDKFILSKLFERKESKFFLVLTKLDLVTKERLLERLLEWQGLFRFHETIPISALRNKNTDTLLEVIKKNLPEGPKYYPEDIKTDNTENFFIAELIREKILNFTHQEVPHSIAVVLEKKQMKKNVMVLTVNVVVEKDSQKKIIIGKDGSKLKLIGSRSRIELERFFNIKIFLELFVKVEPEWRSKQKTIEKLGY